MCKRRACRSRPAILFKFKFENMKKRIFKMFNKVACLRSLAVMALLVVVSVEAFAQISVMTFNIRLDASVDGPNVWANRKAAVCEMLHYYSPDLLGLQEVCPNQMEDLKAGLPDYEALGVGRDDGKHMGEHSPVFFKKSRYKLIKHGDFSLSETPEVFGTKGWDASYNRVCSWAILKDLKSGKKIAFFNTHLDNDGQVARREGIRLILNRIKEYAPGMPAIITADYNCSDGEAPFTVLRENGMSNVRDIAPVVYGPSYSWHDYGRLPVSECPLLDHVFVSHQLKATRYRVVQDKPENVWLSDHFPVLVNLNLK